MGIKKGDLLVLSLILIVATVLFIQRAAPVIAGSRTLRVELDGRLVEEVSFDLETSETIIVEMPAGEAQVQIDAGRVRVLPMSREVCPQGICSSVGWVERSGDVIVCMPNRLILTVLGGPVNELWESLDGVTK
jgi:hypothetical protein